MELLTTLAPHGSREEWFLELIGVLLVLLAAAFVRLFGPLGRGARLRAMFLFLALNMASFVGAELIEFGPARRVFGGLAIVFICLALARAVFHVGFDVLIARSRRDPLPSIVRDLAQGAVLLVAALIALPAAGIEPGQILTTSAILTVVVGMAIQETLGNFVAGLAIQTERPFQVGDWIEVHGQPGHIGRVREINWRATRLHTLDNVDLVVPNGMLAKASFTNYDRPHRAARRSVYFHVPFSVPTRVVHDAVLPSLAEVPGVLVTPPPSIVTFSFDESGVGYWLRFFIDDMSTRDAIDGAVRDRIWYSLARAGLPLSVPGRAIATPDHVETQERSREAKALDERTAMIAASELFRQLAPEAQRHLAERARFASYAPGEVIIRQGELGNAMYLVRRGELAVRIKNGGGLEHEVARLSPGAFFGEMALLTGETRRATIVSVTTCELLVINHEAFRELLASNDSVVKVIGAKVAQRNAELTAKGEGLPVEPEKVVEASDALATRIRRFFGLDN
ncbi:mechanosensitive ion channel family protein [Myxococcota bacterium]|nr:mechanosensitive ion channel family protein [Myxococcota bacterium]